MLDFINSQDREGLIKLGKKYKIIGHLSNFTSPYLTDDQIRLSVIKEMEMEEQIQSQSGGNKNRSLKKKYAKRINSKRLSKKQRDYGVIDNTSLPEIKSFYDFPRNGKLIGIGDLHGDLQVTIKYLKLAGVIPMSTNHNMTEQKDLDTIEWIGGNTIVVQVGDQIDRCRPNNWYRDVCADDSTYQDEGSDLKIMNLMDNLGVHAEKVGGKVISILGNHEIMNCVGDFRYVSPKEFEEFGIYCKAKKTQHKRIFPYGYKERKQAFSPGGIIAKRYANNRYSIVQVGDWIFCHGGITPQSANKFSFDEVNIGIRNWLMGKRDRKTKEVFEYMYDDDDNGIFWTREFGDLGNWEDERSSKLFKRTMDTVNSKNNRSMDNLAKGLIVGHTPQYMNNKGINSSCGGKMWRVDIGASKAFGPCTNGDYENKFRKCAVLLIENGDECKIIKEK